MLPADGALLPLPRPSGVPLG